ncbi:putative elongator complex protein 4 [Aphelenchoides bicaudatus]|nr:putative elongator complex protein 4 [Aphelenchoides bicaudatus]
MRSNKKSKTLAKQMIRSGNAARLPGTRIQNRCPVASVGVDAIDSLMGGGLPLSSVYVISELESRKYAPLLQRYFVAEALTNKHAVYVDGPTLNFNELIENLPSSSANSVPAQEELFPSRPNDDMKIAWRYKTQPAMNSALSVKDKTKFDLTKKMDANEIDLKTGNSTSYASLWQHLFELCRSDQFAQETGHQVLRIFLDGIGSPLFEDGSKCQQFLRNLKALIQQANAIVMLSIDESVLNQKEHKTLLSIADAYFRLDVPDAETKKNIGLEERYDGHFQIVKLPHLNSFTTNKPDCVDLVFEKHRRYLEIRILHLPAVMGGADVAKTPCQSIQEQF